MSEEAKPHKEYHGDGTYTITTAIERTMQAGEKLGWWGDYAARFVAFPMIVGGVLGAVWNMIGLTRAKDMVEDHKRQKGRLYCQSTALAGVGLCGLIYMYQERLENEEKTKQFLEDQASGAIDARLTMMNYKNQKMEIEPENGIVDRMVLMEKKKDTETE